MRRLRWEFLIHKYKINHFICYLVIDGKGKFPAEVTKSVHCGRNSYRKDIRMLCTPPGRTTMPTPLVDRQQWRSRLTWSGVLKSINIWSACWSNCGNWNSKQHIYARQNRSWCLFPMCDAALTSASFRSRSLVVIRILSMGKQLPS